MEKRIEHALIKGIDEFVVADTEEARTCGRYPAPLNVRALQRRPPASLAQLGLAAVAGACLHRHGTWSVVGARASLDGRPDCRQRPSPGLCAGPRTPAGD